MNKRTLLSDDGSVHLVTSSSSIRFIKWRRKREKEKLAPTWRCNFVDQVSCRCCCCCSFSSFPFFYIGPAVCDLSTVVFFNKSSSSLRLLVALWIIISPVTALVWRFPSCAHHMQRQEMHHLELMNPPLIKEIKSFRLQSTFLLRVALLMISLLSLNRKNEGKKKSR